MDCNPSGSSLHGILQARILEWVVEPLGQGRVGKKSRSLRKTDQWGYVEGEVRVIQENQVLMGGWSDPLHQIQSSTMRMKNEPLNLAM